MVNTRDGVHVKPASADGEMGAAATEFVLIAPMLIILFFGIIEFGLAFYQMQLIEAAAREGARIASVGGDAAEVDQAVWDAAVGFDDDEVEVVAAELRLCESPLEPTDTAIVVIRTTDVAAPRVRITVPFLFETDPTFGATATFRCEKASS